MSTPTDTPNLSGRELQIIHLAEQGMTDKQIAKELGISKATVSTYWVRVREKLGKVSRTEVVATTMRADWDHQLEEIRRKQGQTGDGADDFWRKVVEEAPDAIFLVSESGHFTDLNAAGAEMFGYDRAEILGQSVDILVPEHFRKDHRECQEEYMRAPLKRPMGEGSCTCAVRKDGTVLPVVVSLGAVRTPVGESVICIVRNRPDAADCADLGC